MRLYAGVLSAVGWFALALQLALLLRLNAGTGIGTPESIVRFLSYFTILTNTLASLALTGTALGHRGTFFSRPSVQTGIAVYITIVGLVYFLILRHLWAPQGPQWLADTLLHYVMPALYVLFWLLFVPKGTLEWRDGLWWLIFPLCYIAYSLAHGAVSGFYPYPFIDVSKLGYGRVLLNSAGMFAAFVICALAYVALSKALAGRKSSATAP